MNLIKRTSKRLWLYLKSVQDKDALLGLEHGELLEGEVLGYLSGNRIAVRLKDICIPVQSGPNLMPGDRIVVRVIKLEPEIVFSLLFKKNNEHMAIEAKA